MKTAVVFYSKDGSTKIAAEILAEKLDADLYPLKEVKKRGRSIFAYLAAGFAGAACKKSEIIDSFKEQMKQYDKICIGTPIWAGNPAPAVNTFMSELDADGKQIIIFTMQADRTPYKSNAKCADIIKETLEDKGAKVLQIIKLYNAKAANSAQRDKIKKQIGDRN